MINSAVPAPARFAGGHPGQADLPGAADRRQRRARPARPRAAAGVGAAAHRRRAGRDLVPLARGPPRQAVPRGAHARLHLPARPAGLRLRPPPRGRAARTAARSRRPPTRSRPTPGPPARTCASRASSESRLDEPASSRRRAARHTTRRRRRCACRPRPRRVSGPDRHPRAQPGCGPRDAREPLAAPDRPSVARAALVARPCAGSRSSRTALLGIVAMQVALCGLGAQIGSETSAPSTPLTQRTRRPQTQIAGSREAKPPAQLRRRRRHGLPARPARHLPAAVPTATPRAPCAR